MSNINFKKPRIDKNYLMEFKISPGILYLQRDLGCLELGENGAPLKTRLYLLFYNGFLTQMEL